MATYDMTATAAGDTYIRDDLVFQASTFASLPQISISSNLAPSNQRSIISFRTPDKPFGADRILNVYVTLAVQSSVGVTPTIHAWTMDRLWTEQASWGGYDTGSSWSKPGGDLVTQIATATVSRSAGASVNASTFSIDVTHGISDWGKNFTLILKDASENAAAVRTKNIWSINTVATVAGKPHVVVRFADDAPISITDLSVSPDISLSESSYTYRQRAILKWTASKESDFKRYRIRKGVNRSQAVDHAHLTFINSRGTTTFLDSALYTDGSTIYYSIYPEDRRNGSTSTSLGATYTNVSNIVSWTKPDATIGSMSIGSSASTLDNIECRVRTTTMANAKKAKIIWGDGAISYSQNLTSAGGYLYARHRYTKATSSYTIRGIIEDVYGFRSAPDSYGTTVTISNLGPIAKVVASPSRQRTGATFGIGNPAIGQNTSRGGNTLSILASFPSASDGVALRVRTRSSTTTGSFSLMLYRPELSAYRIVNSQEFTSASANSTINRNLNWNVRKGDIVAIHTAGMVISAEDAGGYIYYINGLSYSSTVYRTVGQRISRWLPTYIAGAIPLIYIGGAYTNSVSFSAKDSFARGSNKTINRFRWAPNYAGDFGAAYATGGSYTTGATSSFYWAWTTATTQFVAVRAVDNSNSSSIDVAGVVIETESTFRIPDNIYGIVTSIKNPRSRAFTQSAALSRDYGTTDLGALEPWKLNVRGKAFVSTSTNNFYTDISNLNAAFQQRWRLYVRDPATTSSYVQGYLVDVPFVQDTNEPTVKTWDATVVVAT